MPKAQSPKPKANSEGWQGWDDYADFYDWENAQTLDRRDVKFWQEMAKRANGPVLELGCGTGRVTIPVARTGAQIVGVDRSMPRRRRPSQPRGHIASTARTIASASIRGDAQLSIYSNRSRAGRVRSCPAFPQFGRGGR